MAQICVVIDVAWGTGPIGLIRRTSQARWGTHGSTPSSPRPSSVICFTHRRGVQPSERFRTPVIVLSDAMLGHMREGVELPLPDEIEVVERGLPACTPEEYGSTVYSTVDRILPRPPVGSPFKVRVTGLVYRHSGEPDTADPAVAQELGTYLREKIYRHRDQIVSVEELCMEDAEVGIFAYGSVARSAKAATRWARRRGMKVGLVRPITLWPFPIPTVERMAAQVRSIVVPEMNLGQIAWEVQAAAAGAAQIVAHGRIDGRLITPEEIQAVIETQFASVAGGSS